MNNRVIAILLKSLLSIINLQLRILATNFLCVSDYKMEQATTKTSI